eukprot:5794329-Prymnesium_polylepis.2
MRPHAARAATRASLFITQATNWPHTPPRRSMIGVKRMYSSKRLRRRSTTKGFTTRLIITPCSTTVICRSTTMLLRTHVVDSVELASPIGGNSCVRCSMGVKRIRSTSRDLLCAPVALGRLKGAASSALSCENKGTRCMVGSTVPPPFFRKVPRVLEKGRHRSPTRATSNDQLPLSPLPATRPPPQKPLLGSLRWYALNGYAHPTRTSISRESCDRL